MRYGNKSDYIRIKEAYGKDPTTLDEVAEAIIAAVKRKSDLIGFSWSINYSSDVCNTHHSPINGTTNWGRNDPTIPTGYPGFYGRVWVRYAKAAERFGSDPLNNTLSHTGSGGFGAYNGPWLEISKLTYLHKHKMLVECYSWDYRIFISDFPELEKNFGKLLDVHEKDQTWKKLANKFTGPFAHHHAFTWEDPETKAEDDRVLVQLRKIKLINR